MKELIINIMMNAYDKINNLEESSKRELGRKIDVVTKGDLEIGKFIVDSLLKSKKNITVHSEEYGKEDNIEDGNEEYYIAIDDIDGSNNLRLGKNILPYCSMIVVFKGNDEGKYKYSDYLYAASLDYINGNIYYTEKNIGKIEIYNVKNGKYLYSSLDFNDTDSKGLAKRISTDLLSTFRGGSNGYAKSDEIQNIVFPNELETVYQKYAAVDSASSVWEYSMVGLGRSDAYVSSRKKAHELPLLYAFCKETGKIMIDYEGVSYDEKYYVFDEINDTVIAGNKDVVNDIKELIDNQRIINNKLKTMLGNIS